MGTSAPTPFYLQPDPRTTNWSLVSSPRWIVSLVSMYAVAFGVLFPLYPGTGPDWSPIDPYTIKIFTDISLCLINLALSFGFIYYEMKLGYSPVCQKVETKGDGEEMIAILMYFYMLSKIWDLWDTITIATSGRPGRLWNLHIFHHSSMLLIGWLAVKFAPGGSSAVMALINTFAHSWIYMYYCLRNLRIVNRVDFSKFNLVHFGSIFAVAVSSLCKDCGYPKDASGILIIFVSIIISYYAWKNIFDPRGGGGGGGGGGSSTGDGGGLPSAPTSDVSPSPPPPNGGNSDNLFVSNSSEVKSQMSRRVTLRTELGEDGSYSRAFP